MDRMFSIGIVGAAFAVLALVVFYGPLMAAFVVAGAAFALMVVLMTVMSVQAFDQWRQGHGWILRRKAR